MRFLNRLLRRCSHRLSWPRLGEDRTHYQICLLCGASFAYDWQEMRRLGKLKSLCSSDFSR
jgi:hypothetical protein